MIIGGIYPLYHTQYETFRLVKTFVDPEFQVLLFLKIFLNFNMIYYLIQVHQTIGRVVGLLALNLTDTDLLPFNPARYYQALVNLLNLTKSAAPESINFSKFIQTRSSICNLQSILASLQNAIDQFKIAADQFNYRVQTTLDRSK